jgi:hypothetical protein
VGCVFQTIIDDQNINWLAAVPLGPKNTIGPVACKGCSRRIDTGGNREGQRRSPRASKASATSRSSSLSMSMDRDKGISYP